ncbi:BQ2448_2457 [Microbotryum intermedium]|uniref:BQ2448_2457 protein n=1 Tax=Microbotryum intermedium TaxID=269621 RepID=A0A238F8G6_9BASI|nr:BQ2448_2457 [Microbotryum intermedium]
MDYGLGETITYPTTYDYMYLDVRQGGSSHDGRPVDRSRSGSSLAPAPMLKRTNSVNSLPSPPDEMMSQELLALAVVYLSDEELNDTDLEEGDDDDDDEAPGLVVRPQPKRSAGRRASNRMLVDCNPFLVPSQCALQEEQKKQARIEARPDHPHASPTHQARRKRLQQHKIKLDEGHAHKLGIGARTMGRGWESPSNPFIAREGETAEPTARRENHKPDKITYVFRGKRVTYDVPLDALLAPEDPEDSPFPDPSPRLLFPMGPTSDDEADHANPITPPSQSRPTSSFLDALRVTTSAKPHDVKSSSLGLPPTPVTERQRKAPEKTFTARKEARFGPYKKMATLHEP